MIQPKPTALLAACAAALLAGCVATGPFPGAPILSGHEAPPAYKGPKAAPQVAYRIDKNRYFEIVPKKAEACYDGLVYYVDTAQGIRSLVMGTSQIGGLDLIIDAANTQYLVAPMIKGGGSCYSCGGTWLPYSVDAGKTWTTKIANSASDPLSVSGSIAYAIGNVPRSLDLTQSNTTLKDWKYVPGYSPRPRIPPLDTKFHCVPNGKE